MRQIEITVKLEENLEDALLKLEKKGFKVIRESDVDDIYVTTNDNIRFLKSLNKDEKKSKIIEILSESVLLRKLKLENNVIQKITYKDKKYDDDGNVISEDKINVNIDDILKTKEILKKLNVDELVEVKYHNLVYSNGIIELDFQSVENLGILIEYENENNFEGKTSEEIKNEKIKMAKQINELGIIIGKDFDIKKAYELIINN